MVSSTPFSRGLPSFQKLGSAQFTGREKARTTGVNKRNERHYRLVPLGKSKPNGGPCSQRRAVSKHPFFVAHMRAPGGSDYRESLRPPRRFAAVSQNRAKSIGFECPPPVVICYFSRLPVIPRGHLFPGIHDPFVCSPAPRTIDGRSLGLEEFREFSAWHWSGVMLKFVCSTSRQILSVRERRSESISSLCCLLG